jgi:peptidoglycan/xylan/chitin deacetylase (PgdA/CDA1 family)
VTLGAKGSWSVALLAAVLAACMERADSDARPASIRCLAVGCDPTICGPKPGERRLRLPARLPPRRLMVPILMYHRINVAPATAPAITRRLTVHPTDFARQMRWLKRHRYRTITQHQLFDALVEGRPLGRRPIMITLDDGYRDAFYKAAPVLSRLGFRATAYVISGRVVDGDRDFLSWGLVRGLERRGIEIGSHSVSHRDLTQLSDHEALHELVRSRRALERGVCHPVPWLAYPFGSHDPRIQRLARQAGYVLAVTTEHGALQTAGRPLALRRLRVLDSTGMRGLAEMLEQAGGRRRPSAVRA